MSESSQLCSVQQQNPTHGGTPDTQTRADVQDTARRRPATRTTKDTPKWMRSIPYTRQHLPSERLTHIIQVEHVTQYHHHPDHPANLCWVFWRPTCLLLPMNKQYLLKQGFQSMHDSPNQPPVDTDTPTHHDTAQWTSTTSWISTIELLECIIASWPLQALV